MITLKKYIFLDNELIAEPDDEYEYVRRRTIGGGLFYLRIKDGKYNVSYVENNDLKWHEIWSFINSEEYLGMKLIKERVVDTLPNKEQYLFQLKSRNN